MAGDAHQNKFQALAASISGDVSTDHLTRQMFATDAGIFRVVPLAVAYPESTRDVIRIITFAGENNFSVHPRGAGSGLCGSAVGQGIVVDFTRHMNRLISLDMKERVFECEPGYRFGELQELLKQTCPEGEGLFFPPDPSSGEYATFGGMYATNASGAHSVKYGDTTDYLLDAEMVLGNGEVVRLSRVHAADPEQLPDNLKRLYRLYLDHKDKIEKAYPAVKHNSSGYNLRGLDKNGGLFLHRLFAGAEGTLGIAVRLKFKLIEKPAFDSLVVAFFDDIVTSAKAVSQILPLGPSGIEIMDKSLLGLAMAYDDTLKRKIPANIDNVLLIEFDGKTRQKSETGALSAYELIRAEGFTDNIHLALSKDEKRRFWFIRKAAVPILYKFKGQGNFLAFIEDACVPTGHLVTYIQKLYDILNRHHVRFVIYGHIAKGLLHTRPLLNLKKSRDIEKMKALEDDVFQLVHRLGGAVSGEHGDGRLRSAYIRKQYPDIYHLFEKTKHLLDEKGTFNPEIKKSIDPNQMQRHLRFGADYRISEIPDVQLQWPDGLAAEIEKCHGCSKCTTVTLATRMCPIYKFTRKEEAAPKAKANVLRSLITGKIAQKELFKAAIKQVMDQCVSCGSCRRECPSNVDIPKMVVEAKAQFVTKHGTSLENRLIANVDLAGRITHKISGPASRIMRVDAMKRANERITGISAKRDIVLFSKRPLYERIRRKEEGVRGGKKILYFPGCDAAYIRPEIGAGAIAVFKRLGMTIHTPRFFCCGLPMLSRGMVKAAGAKVLNNLSIMKEQLDRVDHVVVTCSSCGFSLMKEWMSLSDDGRIVKVREKLIHFSRLVSMHMDKLRLKTVPTKLAYHMPCHLKIQPDPACSVSMLKRIPEIQTIELNGHCCGMAGSWGFLAKNYELSRKIGTDLRSKLAESRADMAVTDCPTCRMQMEHLSPIPVLHPVEILSDVVV